MENSSEELEKVVSTKFKVNNCKPFVRAILTEVGTTMFSVHIVNKCQVGSKSDK